MQAKEGAAVADLGGTDRASTALVALAALRPRQWSKNLLVFAGLIFAAKLGDSGRWVDAVTAFVAYCAASSAGYLVNDVVDAPHDRGHPVKRFRPVARGELAPRHAIGLAAALVLLATTLVSLLGRDALWFLAAFVVLQATYTFVLRQLVLLDVMAIAALFVLRAAAGAAAVQVAISPWLLVCTALLALFLALAKRRGELVSVGAGATPRRSSLERYSLALVDRLAATVALATVIAYSLYTLTAHDSHWMMVTIPFVLFGVLRYLLLMHRHGVGEEPEHILLSDAPTLGAVLLWAATSAVILAYT